MKGKLDFSYLTERENVEIISGGVISIGKPVFHFLGVNHSGRSYKLLLKEDFWGLYKKIKKLGEGANGLVFKCEEVSTGKIVAVKCVRTREEEEILMVLLLRELESVIHSTRADGEGVQWFKGAESSEHHPSLSDVCGLHPGVGLHCHRVF